MSWDDIALWVALIALYFGCRHDIRKLAFRIESNKEKLERIKDGLDGIYDKVYIIEETLNDMKGEQNG